MYLKYYLILVLFFLDFVHILLFFFFGGGFPRIYSLHIIEHNIINFYFNKLGFEKKEKRRFYSLP